MKNYNLTGIFAKLKSLLQKKNYKISKQKKIKVKEKINATECNSIIFIARASKFFQ